MLKIAVFAPMPSASVATTIRANAGRVSSERTANLTVLNQRVHGVSPWSVVPVPGGGASAYLDGDRHRVAPIAGRAAGRSADADSSSSRSPRIESPSGPGGSDRRSSQSKSRGRASRRLLRARRPARATSAAGSAATCAAPRRRAAARHRRAWAATGAPARRPRAPAQQPLRFEPIERGVERAARQPALRPAPRARGRSTGRRRRARAAESPAGSVVRARQSVGCRPSLSLLCRRLDGRAAERVAFVRHRDPQTPGWFLRRSLSRCDRVHGASGAARPGGRERDDDTTTTTKTSRSDSMDSDRWQHRASRGSRSEGLGGSQAATTTGCLRSAHPLTPAAGRRRAANSQSR